MKVTALLFVLMNMVCLQANCLEKSQCTDTLALPDVNDVFFLLTSDSVAVEEGIFRNEYIAPTLEEGVTVHHIDYELFSKSRKIKRHGFYWEQSLQGTQERDCRKLVLPKDFLQKITPVDWDEKFKEFKDVNELRDFLHPMMFIFDLKKESLQEIQQRHATWKQERKRVWVIDRRYMTEDEMLLLEVKPGYVLDTWPADAY